jgi:hypothetical protein
MAGSCRAVAPGRAFWLSRAPVYRAWLPLERIRPVNIPQDKWEETFAWPANNKPPYPPLTQRALRSLISYMAVILIAAALLQVFTPFPVLTWLAKLTRVLFD